MVNERGGVCAVVDKGVGSLHSGGWGLCTVVNEGVESVTQRLFRSVTLV